MDLVIMFAASHGDAFLIKDATSNDNVFLIDGGRFNISTRNLAGANCAPEGRVVDYLGNYDPYRCRLVDSQE